MVMLPLIIRPMVWSSRALATASAAILPPAPTLFSTITGWPRALDSGSLNVRAVRSGEDPAGKPTMILSGLGGPGRGGGGGGGRRRGRGGGGGGGGGRGGRRLPGQSAA